MVDNELGLTAVFNGCIYDYQELRAELEGHGYRFFSHSDTEVILKGYHHWGTDVVEHLHGMFAVRHPRARHRPGRPGPRPARASSRCTSPRPRAGCASPRTPAGAAAPAGDVDTSIDPVALHHYLTWHAVVPAPRTHAERRPQAAAGDRPGDRGRRLEHRAAATGSRATSAVPSTRTGPPRDWEDAVEDALRTAVRRRLVADIPVGVLLSGGLDSSLIVGLLAQEGQTGLATFSHRLRVGRRPARATSSRYSDVIAEHFGTDHHRIRVGSDELAGSLGHAIGAMAEPMVSHDVVAFDLLSERVSQSHQGRAVRARAPTRCSPATTGTRRWPGVDREAGVAALRRARSSTATTPSMAPRRLRPVRPGRATRAWRFVRAHMSRPGARDRGGRRAAPRQRDHARRRPGEAGGQHVHGAGAWRRACPFLDHDLVELAAPCPPELKLADGGKGVLKAIGRRIIPPEVIDRPKGYFPVPAITHLEGKVLDLVRDALASDAARERGAVPRRSTCGELLADPNGELTPLKGNKLWQLGLLELWLQTHGV